MNATPTSSNPRIGILFSSGKDSTNALWYYREQGWNVACLLTLQPKNTDSYMFQTPSERLAQEQSRALELPLVIQPTSGEKELELEDLRLLLQHAKHEYAITGIASGALASDYQEERINRICHELGLKTYAPLWHKNQEQLLREMIAAGFDIRMTRVAADGLDKKWLGKKLMNHDVDQLVVLHKKYGVAVGGEGGEFETIVLDGPVFAYPIAITFDVHMESECRGELSISSVTKTI